MNFLEKMGLKKSDDAWDREFDVDIKKAMENVDLTPDPVPEVLAIARTQRILKDSIIRLHEDQQQLEIEIRERLEKLRQVKLVIAALTPANNMLIEDMSKGSENRMPPLTETDTPVSPQPQFANGALRASGNSG